MLIPPQAAFVLATALAAVPPASIPTQGGRETFVLDHMQWRRHEIALVHRRLEELAGLRSELSARMPLHASVS